MRFGELSTGEWQSKKCTARVRLCSPSWLAPSSGADYPHGMTRFLLGVESALHPSLKTSWLVDLVTLIACEERFSILHIIACRNP